MSSQTYDFEFTKKKRKKLKVFLIIIYVILIYVLMSFLLNNVIFSVKQISNTMAPDYPEKSISFVTPVYANPRRGDVVLVSSEADSEKGVVHKIIDDVVKFFSAQQYSLEMKADVSKKMPQIRRIIGMPGDEIYMRDYVLYIKPAGEKHFLTEFEIIHNAYNLTFYTPPSDWTSSIGVKGSFDTIKLSNEEYFVLGDNRLSVSDSRLWGPVTKDSLKGKVLLTYFPFNKLIK